MEHRIEQTTEGLQIHASVAPGKQQALLEEFGKCAAGTCSCRSAEYGKLAQIQAKAGAGGVTVDLAVKPGERIDVGEIERCLDHTARQIGA